MVEDAIRIAKLADLGTSPTLQARLDAIFLQASGRTFASGSERDAFRQRRRAIDHPIHGVWAIVDRETGSLFGNLLLKPAPLSIETTGDAPVEIGWHLHPDAQGAGYATEAAGAVMADASQNGLSTVIAVIDPRNTASQRVCFRLGMESQYSCKTGRPLQQQSMATGEVRQYSKPAC